MRSLVYLDEFSRRFAGSTNGDAVSFPSLAALQSFTLAMRFLDRVNNARVETERFVRSIRATVGNVDARPTSGSVTFKITADAPSEANTTRPIDWKLTSDDVQKIFNDAALTAKPAEIRVEQAAGSWIVSRDDGAALALSVVSNTLLPVAFARIRGYQTAGKWFYDVRLTQAPLVTTSTFDLVDPPPPSISTVRDGGKTDDGVFKWNEVQALFLPPDFRGVYQIRDPRSSAKSALLDGTDGPVDIQAAVQAILADGETVTATNPQANVAHLEFGGTLGGIDLAPFEVTVFSAPAGDPTFTLDLTHPVLLASLRSAETLSKIPFEVEFEFVDSAAALSDPDAPSNFLKTSGMTLTITRPVAWEGLALAANTDWLRPPQSTGYRPYTSGQIITGQQHYEEVIGDGAAYSFPIDHNLATEALSGIEIRENAEDGRYLRDAEYVLRSGGANSLVVDFTGLLESPPAPAAYVVIITAAGPTSVFQEHTHTIAEVVGLQDVLDGYGTAIAALQAFFPAAGLAAGVVSGEALSIVIPAQMFLLPYSRQTTAALLDLKLADGDAELPVLDPAKVRPRPLLGMIPDALPELLPGGDALPPAAANKNQVFAIYGYGAPQTLPAVSGIRETVVPEGGIIGSNGSFWYALNRLAATRSYYAAAFERNLFPSFDVNAEQFAVGSLFDLEFRVGLQLIGANCQAQVRLIVETCEYNQEASSSPTTGPNLQAVSWEDNGVVAFEQIIVLSGLMVEHRFGLRVSRGADAITAEKLIYGRLLAGAVAPTYPDFAIRARLVEFDTENIVGARGNLFVTLRSATAKITS